MYLHLPWKSTKCRYMYHTWILWEWFVVNPLGFAWGVGVGWLGSRTIPEPKFNGLSARQEICFFGLGMPRKKRKTCFFNWFRCHIHSYSRRIRKNLHFNLALDWFLFKCFVVLLSDHFSFIWGGKPCEETWSRSQKTMKPNPSQPELRTSEERCYNIRGFRVNSLRGTWRGDDSTDQMWQRSYMK